MSLSSFRHIQSLDRRIQLVCVQAVPSRYAVLCAVSLSPLPQAHTLSGLRRPALPAQQVHCELFKLCFIQCHRYLQPVYWRFELVGVLALPFAKLEQNGLEQLHTE